MRGDYVLVRACSGEPVVVRVWDELPGIVLVSSPDQYELLASGKESLMPVGVRRDDVFCYGKQTAAPMVDWDREVRY